MQITKIAIYRPVTTLMLSLALVFLGVVSYRELAVQYYPDVTLPTIGYGARVQDVDISPEKTNDILTRPFEKMVASLPGVKKMRSNTRSGLFWGEAEFAQGTDMRFRVIELQDKVNKWRSDQTEKITTNVTAFSTEEFSGQLMSLILSIPEGQEFQTSWCTDLIRRKLRSIDGISQVDISGEMEPNLALETERDQLLARGFDVDRLVSAINSGFLDKTWLGALQGDSSDKTKRTARSANVYIESKIDTAEALLNMRLDHRATPAPGANQTEEEFQPILKLGDLVWPERKIAEQETVFRFNGKKSVSIEISKEKDRNTIRMARLARARIDEIRGDLPSGFELIENKRPQLPPGFDLTILEDEAIDLEEMIVNIAKLAALGSLMAMLVLLVFVRSWRVAMIVALAIPTSILITFNALYAANVSINVLSLLGLTIGVGMLVDNAIVVVENVFRHSQRNQDPREAAWIGSREVARAILISTSTNLVVFIPILLIDEQIAIIMKEMALSIVFPLVISLFVAVTLIPMLTSKVCGRVALNQKKKKAEPSKRRRRFFPNLRNPWQKPNRRRRSYLREFVFFCAKGYMRHPVRLLFTLVIFLFITLFVSGIKVAMQAGISEQKTRSVTLYGKPVLGSSIDEVDAFFSEKEREIAKFVDETPAFESFSTRFSETGGEIKLRVASEYQKLQEGEFHRAYYRRLRSGDGNSGFRFWPFPSAASQSNYYISPQGRWQRMPEAIEITGENIEAMARASEIIKAAVEEDDEVEEVHVQTPPGPPEVHFIPDQELFRVMKADLSSIGSFFRSRSDRGVSTQLVLTENDIERRVTVRAVSEKEEREEEERVGQTLSELKRTEVSLQGGGTIPLERLGTFEIAQGVYNISKEDRQRHLRIQFRLKNTHYRRGMEKQKQDTLKRIQKDLQPLRLPMGVTANLKGTLDAVDTQREIWKKMLKLGILALFVVMAFFFDSLFLPIVILATLPLACVGGLWGMILLNTTFNEVAMVGALLLGGLAVNNGILLVERTRQMERLEGFSRPRALMSAVSHRLRPILMTSLTTILGLLPILLSDEAEKVHSLVSVAIGGVIVSGILSLVVIPTLYNVLSIARERLMAWRKWQVWRFIPRWRIPLLQPLPAGAASTLAAEEEKEEETTDAPRFAILHASSLGSILDAPPPETLHISIDNVSKIYPRFKARKLLNFIPSRDYPYGHRPPRGTEALRHVSLEIEPGMFGLLGPNGAGKTTLMKILTGIVQPTYGTVHLAGHNLRHDAEQARHLVSYLPQNFGVYESLNLEQYLNFFAGLPTPYKTGLEELPERRRRIAEVAEMVGLGDVRHKPMKRFSGGMRQRAGIAQLLLTPRPIVIVDEPTAGLDPVERVRFRLLLSKLAQTRIVILSTHIVDDITSSCKRVAVLNRSTLLYEGNLDRIQIAARNRIWDLIAPVDAPPDIPRQRVLFRKHLGDRILYHYVADHPLPGSEPVDPSFEDAYVALLLAHDMADLA